MIISEILTLVSSLNWLEVLGALTTTLVGLIALFELIPGEQPEKTLRAIVNVIAKFSRK
jgi:uncharacterized membrane protein YuzA (DUF378 family)